MVIIIALAHIFMPNVNVKIAKADSTINGEQIPIHIIFNSIPKSASVYITKTLERSLRCGQVKVSNGYFPHDNLSYVALEKFNSIPCVIAKTHIDASIQNQQLFKKFTKNVFVQFRDPREVLLSWIHYIQRIYDENKIQYLYYFAPTPPQKYYSWDLNHQIDWNIENFLPEVVQWMQGWIRFKENEDKDKNGLNVLIATYDDFVKDPKGYYSNLLNLFEIPENKFDHILLPLDMSVHYRTGDQSEWERVFSISQKRKIAKIVPDALLQKFNWKPNVHE